MAMNFDMFSFLPDALLAIIVSSLPFKEAARTCILSKQWKDIWKSTKNIEFNEFFFVKHDDDQTTRDAQRRVFINIITNWIAKFKEPVVEKFSLKVSSPESIRDTVECCVAFATKREVKELKLDFSEPNWEENHFENYYALFELPKHVYGNEGVESLKLYSCSFVIADMLKFEALKDVSLGWIEVNIHALKTLLSTCKTIENLSLKRCWNLEHFDITEKLRLRRLIIDKCDFSYHYFQFNAPNLKYLKYSGFAGTFYVDVQPDVIEEAEIDFALVFQYDEFGNELYRLLQDLYAVRVLTIDSFLLQLIPSGENPMRINCDLNVTHLIMKTRLHPHEMWGFRFLLNSCPMLEKLTLEIDPAQEIFHDYIAPFKANHEEFWRDLPDYQCLRTTLKVVEVKRFRGIYRILNAYDTLDDFFALQYLFQIGKVLEMVNINVLKDEHVEDRRASAMNLLHVPRASTKLNITIA